jgi:hypothetical protein
MQPSDRLAVIGQELDLDHQQQSDRRERESDERHVAQQLSVDPFALQSATDQELHEKRVFDAHAKIFARLLILIVLIFRKGTLQRILKSVRRAGKQHEVQRQRK